MRPFGRSVRSSVCVCMCVRMHIKSVRCLSPCRHIVCILWSGSGSELMIILCVCVCPSVRQYQSQLLPQRRIHFLLLVLSEFALLFGRERCHKSHFRAPNGSAFFGNDLRSARRAFIYSQPLFGQHILRWIGFYCPDSYCFLAAVTYWISVEITVSGPLLSIRLLENFRETVLVRLSAGVHFSDVEPFWIRFDEVPLQTWSFNFIAEETQNNGVFGCFYRCFCNPKFFLIACLLYPLLKFHWCADSEVLLFNWFRFWILFESRFG